MRGWKQWLLGRLIGWIMSKAGEEVPEAALWVEENICDALSDVCSDPDKWLTDEVLPKLESWLWKLAGKV